MKILRFLLVQNRDCKAGVLLRLVRLELGIVTDVLNARIGDLANIDDIGRLSVFLNPSLSR